MPDHKEHNPDEVQILSGGILQPPRAFRVTLNFEIPADTRPDAFWQDFFFGGVSLALNRSRFGKAGDCQRVAVMEKPRG